MDEAAIWLSGIERLNDLHPHHREPELFELELAALVVDARAWHSI